MLPANTFNQGQEAMDLLIIGTGYVGLVTGACMADMGHKVTCLDINQDKVEQLNRGIIPIYEPGLEEIVKRNVQDQRLQFTTNYASAVAQSLVCFICVDTPSREDGACELANVESCCKSLAEHMDSYKVIVNKSTVPVGTALQVKESIQSHLQKRGVEISFDVVSNPEFLKEGDAVNDCKKPDRIVIGSDSSKAMEIMRELYAPFTVQKDRILMMDIASAELTKYASNAMLATRISFMNELSRLCEYTGANIHSIRQGMGSDPRIGYPFLYAGVGFGGSCFPKDLRALGYTARTHGMDLKILGSVQEVNREQKLLLGEKIHEYFLDKGGLEGKTIALWGLSFKPDTDDMREAPSLVLIRQLASWGVRIRVYDPIAMDNAKKVISPRANILWCESELEAAQGADGLALLTEWKQFRFPDFPALHKAMKDHVIFDGRNQYRPEKVTKEGFDYYGIGVPSASRHVSESEVAPLA